MTAKYNTLAGSTVQHSTIGIQFAMKILSLNIYYILKHDLTMHQHFIINTVYSMTMQK
jgi:hypothetical protein